MLKNRHNPEFYSSLINRSCGLICVVDENGLFKYANEALYGITGYRSEDLQGKVVLEYLHNNDLQAIRNIFLHLATFKSVDSFLFRFKTKNGNWKWIDAVITNLLDDEEICGYIIDARDVTSKRAAIKEQEKNKGFYNSFLQNNPHAVFVLSPEGLFEYVNTHASHLLAYNPEEIIGEHFTRFIASSFSFEATKALIRAKDNEPSALEGKAISKLGRIVSLRLSLIPVYNETRVTSIVGMAEDITAEKKALKELEKLSVIASKAVSAVMITDEAGKIEWVNSEFTRITGYSMQEAVGKKPGNLLQGKDTDPVTVQEMREALKNKLPFSVEVINYRKNGQKFWFSMDITPLYNDSGNISKFFALQTDVTSRKEAEERTRLLAEDLTRRNRELQQFNYIVSHNLRSPVANIMGLASILENRSVDEKTKQKAVEKIKHTALNLDHVIKDLDEILSLKRSTTEEQWEEVNMETICNEVAHSLQTTIENLKAGVFISVPAHVTIQASRAYMYSIFHNLLSNALKYSSPERAPEISVKYTPTPEQHVFVVADNGIGIDLDKHGEHVFKLYSKFDKNAEGRGLGLYMVKTQVESLHGCIDVKSTPGNGTSFLLRFPRAIRAQAV